MTRLMTRHQNSEGFAKGLLPYIQTALPTSTCRPWNRFEAQETEWLLSPVREWPLYRPCKYYTGLDREDDPVARRLIAGIYAEKGFGFDTRTVNSKGSLMDSRWGWHRVLEGFRSGAIPAVLSGMPLQCRNKISILLDGGYDGAPYGGYLITLADGKKAELCTSVLQASEQMAALTAVESWKDLAAALDEMSGDSWLWVNLYLYLSAEPAPRDGVQSAEVWTDQQVWNEFLEPLLPWITEK